MPGDKRPPDGYVSTTKIADKLGVDRRVLKQLHERGEFAGVREGGVLWLERGSLAAYLWSRPRCVRDDCDRRVIGDGPGCHLHRRSGRHHSLETRRQMSKTHGGQGLPEKICEQCGKPFVGRGKQFCSKSCRTTAANIQRGPSERLQEGRSEYRARVERVRAERGLIAVAELVDTPARDGQRFRAGLLRGVGVPRTAGAISGHIDRGALVPVRDLGFGKPHEGEAWGYLFTEVEVKRYIEWLHREDQAGPGRPLHYDNDPRWRGQWYQARHKSSAESGRSASAINKAGPKVKVSQEAQAEILKLRESSQSLKDIYDAFEGEISVKKIRGVLARGK